MVTTQTLGYTIAIEISTEFFIIETEPHMIQYNYIIALLPEEKIPVGLVIPLNRLFYSLRIYEEDKTFLTGPSNIQQEPGPGRFYRKRWLKGNQ